jgi:hypothetical protein
VSALDELRLSSDEEEKSPQCLNQALAFRNLGVLLNLIKLVDGQDLFTRIGPACENSIVPGFEPFFGRRPLPR